jgi:hypothetical protein
VDDFKLVETAHWDIHAANRICGGSETSSRPNKLQSTYPLPSRLGRSIWTCKDACLMASPDGQNRVLSVGPSDHSEGRLSLCLSWAPCWTTRTVTSLPPGWICLSPCRSYRTKTIPSSTSHSVAEATAKTEKSKYGGDNSQLESLNIVEIQQHPNGTGFIYCDLSVDGSLDVVFERPHYHVKTANIPGLYETTGKFPTVASPSVEHLQARDGSLHSR